MASADKCATAYDEGYKQAHELVNAMVASTGESVKFVRDETSPAVEFLETAKENPREAISTSLAWTKYALLHPVHTLRESFMKVGTVYIAALLIVLHPLESIYSPYTDAAKKYYQATTQKGTEAVEALKTDVIPEIIPTGYRFFGMAAGFFSGIYGQGCEMAKKAIEKSKAARDEFANGRQGVANR